MSDYYDEPPYSENDHSVTLNTEVVVEWSNEVVVKEIVDKVSARIYDDIKPQVSKAVLDCLEDQVNLAISSLLDSQIQPTDRWGAPKGTTVSIREMLQREAEQWLTEQVDEYGRSDRGSYNKEYPRIHWLFQKALRGETNHRGTTALESMVIKAVKETIGDVEAVVTETVKAAVKKRLG